MKKFTFKSPQVKFKENDLTESQRNDRVSRSSLSSSGGDGESIGTTTTTTAAPTYYLGQQVFSGGTPTSGYTTLTYAENSFITFSTSGVTGFNYLFISLPDSKNYIIYNALDINITSTFSKVGTYVVGAVTNAILRSDDVFATDTPVTYKIYIT